MEKRFSEFTAEIIGTAVLVIGGCGSVIFGGPTMSILSIALAFGLSLAVMAYTVGPISGCHLNPAVSFAMLLTKKIDGGQFVSYLLAQFIGAALGGAVLFILCYFHKQGVHDILHSHGFATNGYGAHSPGGFSPFSCFLAEVVLTALFVFVVLTTTRAEFPAGFGGLVVGLALVVVHLVGVQLTGTSVNPARSFGVAIFKGGHALEQLWMFVAAPLLGSLLSVILHKLLRLPHHSSKKQ